MNCSARRPCFVDHLFLTSDFRQVPRRNFLQFSHSLSTASFCCRNFHSLSHGNEFVNQIFHCCSELSPFPAMWSSWWVGNDSRTRSLEDSLASRIHASFDLNSLVFATGLSMLTLLACLARHSGSHWCFQFLVSILDGLLECLVLRVDEINPSQFSCVIELTFIKWPLLLLLQLSILSHFLPEFWP